MFGIFADLLSSVITILFPIFASYKALRSSNPSELAPWLIYWVVLSVILLAESWTVFILGWFPFYSWIRLFFLCYLVLPQTQGARLLYLQYVDPFLEQHEREIEEFIGRSHERAKALGLQYFYQAIDLIREKVLGLPPQTAAPPPPSGPASYAQSLLSRFNMPSTSGGTSQAVGNDWFSTISSAVTSVTSTGQSHETRAQELSASGNLLPRELASMPRAERAKYISSQQDMLEVLRTALAQEERNLGSGDGDEDLAYGGPTLRKNRSDNSFDHINHEDTRERSPAGGGWTSGWFGQQGEQGGTTGVDLAARAAEELMRR